VRGRGRELLLCNGDAEAEVAHSHYSRVQAFAISERPSAAACPVVFFPLSRLPQIKAFECRLAFFHRFVMQQAEAFSFKDITSSAMFAKR